MSDRALPQPDQSLRRRARRARRAARSGAARRRGQAIASARATTPSASSQDRAARRRIIALGEPDYPPRLRMIDDAPPLLAVRGKISVLTSTMIAMVGSRNASAAGAKFAERIARELGEAGFVDRLGARARHRRRRAPRKPRERHGRGAGRRPRSHLSGRACRCSNAILPNGAAVTEMPLGWEPRGRDFPRRNRLISGLSLGVVIVEAARRSGSLITARMATNRAAKCSRCRARRSIRAPRAPTACSSRARRWSPKPPTCSRCSGRSWASESSSRSRSRTAARLASTEPASDERARIVDLLGPAPVSIDDLVRLSQSSPAIVRTVLLELEIAGRLERHGGGLVSLV